MKESLKSALHLRAKFIFTGRLQHARPSSEVLNSSGRAKALGIAGRPMTAGHEKETGVRLAPRPLGGAIRIAARPAGGAWPGDIKPDRAGKARRGSDWFLLKAGSGHRSGARQAREDFVDSHPHEDGSPGTGGRGRNEG